jgi:hypothetical protein
MAIKQQMSAEQLIGLISDPRFAGALSDITNKSGELRNARRRMPFPYANLKDVKDTDVAKMIKDNWTTTYPQLADATIYGRNSIFDPCFAGDIFGLQVQTHGLLNWLGWRPNPYWKRTVQFITWWRGEGAEDGITGAGSPCENPLSWEWGECSYELCHNSWYHRQGQPLGPHNTQIRCETDQKYRLNGTLITDEFEWQMNGIMWALQQDIDWDVVHGSHLNDFEMNGLETAIRTGYEDNNGNHCPMVDSWLINWGNDDLDGAVNNWGNFFDFMHELVGQIEWRSRAIGDIAETDMVLYTSPFMADCILDAFACYQVCGGTNVSEASFRPQVLAYRQSLNAGPMYDGSRAVGFIKLKNGRRLPIMVDDSFSITKPNANYCTDVYLLTRQIGGTPVLYGEYLDLGQYSNQIAKFGRDTEIRVEAGGRFAFRGKMDNWCGLAMVGVSPELYLSAPWAQARIMNVCCARKFKPVVGTPFQPDYIPGGKMVMYPSSSWGMDCTDVPGAYATSPRTPQ